MDRRTTFRPSAESPRAEPNLWEENVGRWPTGPATSKAGDSKAAAESFAKVADCYLRDGYLLKAAALLKQVLRLAPGLVPARETLVTVLDQSGLKPDAVEHLKVLLREYAILGRAADAARVAKALADLGHHIGVDPSLCDS